MDKLLNIGRTGGFPVSTEVLEVLASYRGAINAILKSFGYMDRSNSCVLLTNEMCYIPSKGGEDGIFRMEKGDVSIEDLVNGDVEKAVVIDRLEKDIIMGLSEYTWEKAYRRDTVRLVDITGNDTPWKFYQIDDLIEPANYVPFSISLPLDGITHLVSGRPLIGRTNRKKTQISISIVIPKNRTSFTISLFGLKGLKGLSLPYSFSAATNIAHLYAYINIYQVNINSADLRGEFDSPLQQSTNVYINQEILLQ